MTILAFTGDVMLGRLVNQVLGLDSYKYAWGNTINTLKKADLSLINLECVISSKGKKWNRTPKVFHFRAHPDAIKVLKAAGIDFVSIANNHILDYQEEALLEMLELLDENKIAHAGAGRNLEEAMKPAFLDANGIKIAVISLTDNEPQWEAKKNQPGINYIPPELSGKCLERIKESIKIAKSKADLAVVSAHVGPNWGYSPQPEYTEFAHRLIDLGVDIYHGHSCHVFQGIEIYKDKVIMYSTGDFADDYVVDPVEKNDQSFIFLLTIDKNKIEKLELIPVFIDKMQVNVAKGDLAKEITNKMKGLCEEFNTKAEIKRNKLIINV